MSNFSNCGALLRSKCDEMPNVGCKLYKGGLMFISLAAMLEANALFEYKIVIGVRLKSRCFQREMAVSWCIALR